MFEKILHQLKEEGLYRSLTSHSSGQGTEILIGGKSHVSFASNDYLGLASHPLLVEAGKRALAEYGAGSGASRLMSGSLLPHGEFEEALAEFMGSESALLFGSGYLANLALITSLAGPGDLILADRLVHASLVDGCRLSRAELKRFRHNDLDHLKYLLHRKTDARNALIVTEGVFSMEGDLAPLPEIVQIAKKSGSRLIVDDAHGFGILGSRGRGTAEHFGIEAEIAIRMGTLGKAAGLYGAFVAGNRSLIEFLINRAKTFIYTTSLPPFIPKMGLAALELLSGGNELRRRLHENRSWLSERLISAGFSLPSQPTPIIPILTRDNAKTVRFSEALFDAGLFIPPIRPPTVPEGKARLRLSVSAAHTGPQLLHCARELTRWGRSLEIL